MPYEFITKSISSRVVTMDNDILDEEAYGASMWENKDENDLYHNIDSGGKMIQESWVAVFI